MPRPRYFTIALHPAAPPKPDVGQPCNGCGVCCALETCPLARLRFWQRHGPCPALRWENSGTDSGHYRCRLLAAPADYWPLPARWTPLLQRLTRRWIAAGTACDAGYVLDPD